MNFITCSVPNTTMPRIKNHVSGLSIIYRHMIVAFNIGVMHADSLLWLCNTHPIAAACLASYTGTFFFNLIKLGTRTQYIGCNQLPSLLAWLSNLCMVMVAHGSVSS